MPSRLWCSVYRTRLLHFFNQTQRLTMESNVAAAAACLVFFMFSFHFLSVNFIRLCCIWKRRREMMRYINFIEFHRVMYRLSKNVCAPYAPFVYQIRIYGRFSLINKRMESVCNALLRRTFRIPHFHMHAQRASLAETRRKLKNKNNPKAEQPSI